MSDFKVLSRTRLVDGWAKLDELEVRIGSGKPQKRFVVEAGDAAAVLLHDRVAKTVLLVRQLRIPLQRHGEVTPLEIVAGKVDEGESDAEAARREVEEEVGHRLETLEPIGHVYPSPGILSEKISLFYGEISPSTAISGGGGDETEELEFVEISESEVFDMLDRAVLHDAKTVIALQWLRNRLSYKRD
jgi:ADP-ribose pyrophosphatase